MKWAQRRVYKILEHGFWLSSDENNKYLSMCMLEGSNLEIFCLDYI